MRGTRPTGCAGALGGVRFDALTGRTYRRQWRAGELCLAEYRAGGGQPFMVPQSVYRAAVQAMAKVREPVSFDDLLDATAQRAGHDLPGYVARATLRFWLTRTPPFIRKVRTRYCRASPRAFKTDALQAFDALPEAG